MAALVVVGGRAATVLDQEQHEPMAGAVEVGVVGIDGQQHRVGLHAGIEPVDQPLEVGRAADAVEQAGLGHGRIQAIAPRAPRRRVSAA